MDHTLWGPLELVPSHPSLTGCVMLDRSPSWTCLFGYTKGMLTSASEGYFENENNVQCLVNSRHYINEQFAFGVEND